LLRVRFLFLAFRRDDGRRRVQISFSKLACGEGNKWLKNGGKNKRKERGKRQAHKAKKKKKRERELFA
jgi:hypothetical protein